MPRCHVELDVEGAEMELEIELTWSLATDTSDRDRETDQRSSTEQLPPARERT